MTLKIASIWRYPVKSMMGEELNACEITENGLLGDEVMESLTMKLENLRMLKIHKNSNLFQYGATLLNLHK